MRNVILSLIMVLSFMASSNGQAHHDMMLEGKDFSFLTPDAKKSLLEVLKKKWEIKREMHKICGIKPAIDKMTKEALKKVKEDKSLTMEAKKKQMKAILKPLKAAMKKNHEALMACKKDKKNENALAPLMNKKMEIKKACYVKLDPAQKKDHKEHHMMKLVKSLTDKQKAELNDKLVSPACMNAIK